MSTSVGILNSYAQEDFHAQLWRVRKKKCYNLSARWGSNPWIVKQPELLRRLTAAFAAARIHKYLYKNRHVDPLDLSPSPFKRNFTHIW